MDLTNNHRALILKGLRDSGVTQTELSQKMGFGKAWVTKLLNGTLKSVSDVDALRLQEILKIQFYQLKKVQDFLELLLKWKGELMKIRNLPTLYVNCLR